MREPRGQVRTLDSLKFDRREIIDMKVGQHGGRTIKLMGDGALMEFTSAVDAAAFAVGTQCTLANRNAKLPQNQLRLYRVGINVGDLSNHNVRQSIRRFFFGHVSVCFGKEIVAKLRLYIRVIIYCDL